MKMSKTYNYEDAVAYIVEKTDLNEELVRLVLDVEEEYVDSL